MRNPGGGGGGWGVGGWGVVVSSEWATGMKKGKTTPRKDLRAAEPTKHSKRHKSSSSDINGKVTPCEAKERWSGVCNRGSGKQTTDKSLQPGHSRTRKDLLEISHGVKEETGTMRNEGGGYFNLPNRAIRLSLKKTLRKVGKKLKRGSGNIFRV